MSKKNIKTSTDSMISFLNNLADTHALTGTLSKHEVEALRKIASTLDYYQQMEYGELKLCHIDDVELLKYLREAPVQVFPDTFEVSIRRCRIKRIKARVKTPQNNFIHNRFMRMD